MGIDPQSLPYGFQNEIMDHPFLDGGPGRNRIECTKFDEECTKFCEGCTKGSKLRFEVGIGSQSLPYGFQNEIMDHPCSDGGLGSNRIRCTKFNEGCTKFCERCTKFCERCTKVSKLPSNVGIGPQSLSYGLLKEIMDHPCLDGDPGSNRIGYTKFCERCTKCSKVRSEVRIGPPNHFLMSSKMKSWTIHVQMGVPKRIGSDVPNLMKDVPNFVKDVPKVL